jgi:Asp-tRNA(Asn)/Glu-tRNA(Gln) amidotransferase C subunit
LATDALHAISQWPDGVAALADLDVFEELRQLAKEETSVDQTQKLCTILDNIAQYKAGNSDSVPEGVDSSQRHNIHL